MSRLGGGDADDLGNLGGSAADPTEEEDTAYAGENDPWYAAFRAAGMSRADLLSRLSCDRVFRFQPAEGGLRSAAFAARHGLRCVLVTNRGPEGDPTGNALLHRLFGAEIVTVDVTSTPLPS